MSLSSREGVRLGLRAGQNHSALDGRPHFRAGCYCDQIVLFTCWYQYDGPSWGSGPPELKEQSSVEAEQLDLCVFLRMATTHSQLVDCGYEPDVL